MTSRAVCVPFHRYTPHHGEYYRVLFQGFLQSLEYMRGSFDKLYLIDSDWNFNFEELDRLNLLGIKFEVIKKEREGHHWVQFHTAMPRINEDFTLFLDNDVFFWRYGVVEEWFKAAEEGKFVSAFDGSGGLAEVMREKYPVLKSLSANRMGSYYFILDRQDKKVAAKTELGPITYKPGDYIRHLAYSTIEGDWQDSFGLFTTEALSRGRETHVITDDRSSIYLQDDGSIVKDPEHPRRLGYYHARNGNLPIFFLNSKFGGYESDYRHYLNITPRRELLRILAWFWFSGGSLYEREVYSMLSDINVSEETWLNYYKAFVDYHGI